MQYLNPYIELCLEGPNSIFKGLNQKDKETLINQHTFAIIKKNQFLFREGDKTRGLICIASGKLKVFKEGVGGREQIIKLLRNQGYIGYRALFNDSPWPFSAIAIEDSAVCMFDRNPFVRLLKKTPELSVKLLKQISEELAFSYMRTVSLTQKHVRGRVAESLLLLRDTYGVEADGKTLRVYMSREDIAHLSNMTTSNAIRTLSVMASEKIIELSGRKISIIDNNTLEHISESG